MTSPNHFKSLEQQLPAPSADDTARIRSIALDAHYVLDLVFKITGNYIMVHHLVNLYQEPPSPPTPEDMRKQIRSLMAKSSIRNKLPDTATADDERWDDVVARTCGVLEKIISGTGSYLLARFLFLASARSQHRLTVADIENYITRLDPRLVRDHVSRPTLNEQTEAGLHNPHHDHPLPASSGYDPYSVAAEAILGQTTIKKAQPQSRSSPATRSSLSTQSVQRHSHTPNPTWVSQARQETSPSITAPLFVIPPYNMKSPTPLASSSPAEQTLVQHAQSTTKPQTPISGANRAPNTSTPTPGVLRAQKTPEEQPPLPSVPPMAMATRTPEDPPQTSTPSPIALPAPKPSEDPSPARKADPLPIPSSQPARKPTIDTTRPRYWRRAPKAYNPFEH